MSFENKKIYKKFSDDLLIMSQKGISKILNQFFDEKAVINIVSPINRIDGFERFLNSFFRPMLKAFPDLYRRTDILFSGIFMDEEWVTGSGHYVGTFTNDWMGIPSNNELTYLRFGEFHKMEKGKAIETFLFLDFVDLLRQIGKWPLLENSLGNEKFIPGPMTSDGIVIGKKNIKDTEISLLLVERMLKKLFTIDQEWRPFWHQNMMWYGPSGYGSYIGIEGFASFQLPYESIFDSFRKGTFGMTCERGSSLDNAVKGHFARFAEGNYIASGGWPSHGGHLCKKWLGIEPKGQQFTCRVSDWWRREGDKLVENWVFVDLIDMLKQLGYDVFKAVNIEIYNENK
tara:strand:+ start:24 stop:1052 length:1029 start_codon:yes stop_codon:yes gene_type:complete